MNRTILFFAALILLASAANTRAAFQDKKTGKPDPSVATAKNDDSAEDEATHTVTPATTDAGNFAEMVQTRLGPFWLPWAGMLTLNCPIEPATTATP